MYIYVHVLFLCTPQRLLPPSSWMHIYIFTFIDLYVHIYTVVVFGTTRQACFSILVDEYMYTYTSMYLYSYMYMYVHIHIFAYFFGKPRKASAM